MRCLPSMKANRHSLKKRFSDEQRQLDEIQSGEDMFRDSMRVANGRYTDSPVLKTRRHIGVSRW